MESIGSQTLAEEAIRLIRTCFWAGRLFDNNKPTEARVNSLHCHVLFILLNHPSPNLTMSQLAEATVSSKQQISKLIGSMEEKGLVKREHDPVNRRRVYVRIQPTGQRMFDEMIQEIRVMMAREIEIFNEREQQELHDCFLVFRKLINKLTIHHYNTPIQEVAQ